jgi:COMPASS component SWD1
MCARSWSRNARFLLASSKDWNITVWDLAADQDPPQPHALIRFDAPVHAAAFHPRNRHVRYSSSLGYLLKASSQIILALLEPGEVYVVDLRKHFRGRTELVEVVEDTDGMEDGEGIARSVLIIVRSVFPLTIP